MLYRITLHYYHITLRDAGQPLIQRILQILWHLILQILRHLVKPLLKGMLLFLPQRTSLLLRQMPEPRFKLVGTLSSRTYGGVFPLKGPSFVLSAVRVQYSVRLN